MDPNNLEDYCVAHPKDDVFTTLDKQTLSFYAKFRGLLGINQKRLEQGLRYASIGLYALAGYGSVKSFGLQGMLVPGIPLSILAANEVFELSESTPVKSIVGDLYAQKTPHYSSRSPILHASAITMTACCSAALAFLNVKDAGQESISCVQLITEIMLGMWLGHAANYVRIEQVMLTPSERQYHELPEKRSAE